jgi:hypothetical protein
VEEVKGQPLSAIFVFELASSNAANLFSNPRRRTSSQQNRTEQSKSFVLHLAAEIAACTVCLLSAALLAFTRSLSVFWYVPLVPVLSLTSSSRSDPQAKSGKAMCCSQHPCHHHCLEQQPAYAVPSAIVALPLSLHAPLFFNSLTSSTG